MVPLPTTHLTFEEYLTYDDGSENRYELFDGELLCMTPATGQHGAIATFLLIQFYLEVQRLQLDWQVRQGETGVRTTDRRSRLPDVCVMTAEQAQAIQHRSAVLEAPPLLVVEVVSLDSVKRDYRYKRSEYAAMNIPEYWIVNPLEGKVSVLLLNEGFYDVTEFRGRDSVCSQTFPDLALTVERILSA